MPGVFLFCSYWRWGCKPEAKRSRVLVIQSFRWDDKNYLELNSDIRKELRKTG